MTHNGSYLALTRTGWARVEHAVNAELWETIDALRAWVGTLDDAAIARLDARRARPVAVTIDFAGCRPTVDEPVILTHPKRRRRAS